MQAKPPFSSYLEFFFSYPPPAYFKYVLRHAPGWEKSVINLRVYLNPKFIPIFFSKFMKADIFI